MYLENQDMLVRESWNLAETRHSRSDQRSSLLVDRLQHSFFAEGNIGETTAENGEDEENTVGDVDEGEVGAL